MRAMMALVLHLGGVGDCGRLIWEWSVHSQESGDLHLLSFVPVVDRLKFVPHLLGTLIIDGCVALFQRLS